SSSQAPRDSRHSWDRLFAWPSSRRISLEQLLTRLNVTSLRHFEVLQQLFRERGVVPAPFQPVDDFALVADMALTFGNVLFGLVQRQGSVHRVSFFVPEDPSGLPDEFAGAVQAVESRGG